MRLLIVLCVVVLCFVRQGCGTFGQFMSKIPSEVGHAFEVAWESVQEAIKKPVKEKRLRPGGKRRMLAHRTTVPTTTEERFQIEFKKNFITPFIEATTPVTGIHLLIPLIDKPLFSSIYEWRQLQMPHRYASQIQWDAPNLQPPEPTKYVHPNSFNYNDLY